MGESQSEEAPQLNDLRQELRAGHGIAVSRRPVERAVAGLHRGLAPEARATVRFETPPGKQMQVDVGEKRGRIGEATIRVSLFVATLGHLRRVLHVRAFRHEREACRFEGWGARSGRSAGCRRRSCSTTPGRWWCTTTA